MRRFVPFSLLLLAGCSSDPTGERKPLTSWVSGPPSNIAGTDRAGQADDDPKSTETDRETMIREQNEVRNNHQNPGYPL